MSTNNITLESDDFKQFMLLLLVADQIHDFTNKDRLKDEELRTHLISIFDKTQSDRTRVSGGSPNGRSRSRRRRPRVRTHRRPRVRTHRRTRTRTSRPLRPRTRSHTRTRSRSRTRSRTRSPLLSRPPSHTATDTKKINIFCDEINKLNTSLKSVYQDGDVALYLLQLLGSFGEKTIQDKYSESQGNFFKFFKKLIEMKKFDGGGGKRKNSSAQNEAVKKSKNKNSLIHEIFGLLRTIIRKINLNDNPKQTLDLEIKTGLKLKDGDRYVAYRRQKLREYSEDLSLNINNLNEVEKKISNLIEEYPSGEITEINSIKLFNVTRQDDSQEELDISGLKNLIKTLIEKINDDLAYPSPNISMILNRNRANIKKLTIINNLDKIKIFEKDDTSKLDNEQKQTVDKIGDLIKSVADVICPTQADKTDGLYNICRTGSNIEEKIKQIVLVKYKQSDILSTPKSSDNNKAIIINNGSNKFDKYTDDNKNLKDYCIYTNACRIDAGSHECNIKEEGTMDLKISSNSSTSASTSDYIDISLEKNKKNGAKFDVKFEFKLQYLHDKEHVYTYTDNTIILQKVYIEVLKLFLKRIAENIFTWPTIDKPEDKDFIGNFIATYSIKTLGDFLQEVNAGIKGGGYTRLPKYPEVSSDIQPKKIILDSDVDRIYMVNDKLSYCRFLAMKSLFPDTAINKNSYAILDTPGVIKEEINPVLRHYGIPELI